MTKTTITERINGIAFDTLTEDDFNFLVERALKSVRKANPNAVRKPSKHQVENLVARARTELLEKADLAAQIGSRQKKIVIKPNLVSPSPAFLLS